MPSQRNVLLLAGLGPYFKSREHLTGTFFDGVAAPELARSYGAGGSPPLDLGRLYFTTRDGKRHSLLRWDRGGSLSLVVDDLVEIERPPLPHLTAFTLQSILHNAGIDFDYLSLDAVWSGDEEPPADDYEIVLLSTTYICDRHSLARAIEWVLERFPRTALVVGGQFSNLKYAQILRRHPEVFCIVRGDAERALPRVVDAIRGRDELSSIKNLVLRADNRDGYVETGIEYLDLDAYPSPSFPGHFPIVPYESMRGCPFSCKFCSFPAASPKWRYKSAQKIVSDWRGYMERNGTTHIRALDSTFTVPPSRLREVLELLPEVGVGWEAYTRANSIKDEDVVDALARANCKALSIGFESMSENTLRYMNKRVTAAQNRRAFELLHDGPVGYRVSFMVGYPGETPDDFQATRNFLVDEFAGQFQLFVFSLQDETMPVWEDADEFGIHVLDEEDPDYAWSHVGMDVDTARALREETLRDVRWKSDDAVTVLWQTDYQLPLMPHVSAKTNARVEKLVERVGMLPRDYPDPQDGVPLLVSTLDRLRECGVFLDVPARADEPAFADTTAR
jgi:tRNA A37 methylthiotransferase MiaB